MTTKAMITLVIEYDETEVPNPIKWDWTSVVGIPEVTLEVVGGEQFRMPDSLTPS